MSVCVRLISGSPLPPSQGLESLWGPADAPALETDSVVLLKRCWGEEASTGRLVLQKLDFLQVRRGMSVVAISTQGHVQCRLKPGMQRTRPLHICARRRL